MKILKKTIFLAFIMFFFHMAYVFVWSLFRASFDFKHAFQSTFGIGLYAIVYASWAYLLSSFIFTIVANRTARPGNRLVIAVAMMIALYLLFRAGDIIDGDFVKTFSFISFLGFMLTIPVIMLASRHGK